MRKRIRPQMKCPVRVIVIGSDGVKKLDYTMDHDDRIQRQRLGRGCMDALNNGELVITIPDDHPAFFEMVAITL